jgi:hypothetical protein
VTHGTLTAYRRGCRCEPCRASNAVARRNERRRPPRPTVTTAADLQRPAGWPAHIWDRLEEVER